VLRFGGGGFKNPNSSCSPSAGALFGPRTPRHLVQSPAKANKGRSSLRANHVGVLRGFVSAYSQKLVAVTRQRFLAPSQPRQCGLDTLRMFVTGLPPYCGGPGMPQRAMTSSRSPSALLRTIGASWSGKIPGTSGGCRSYVGGAEQPADRGLAFGLGVQVAHVGPP
jgi:hypothetical protein